MHLKCDHHVLFDRRTCIVNYLLTQLIIKRTVSSYRLGLQCMIKVNESKPMLTCIFIHSFIADIYIASFQVGLLRSAPNPSEAKIMLF